MNTLKLTSFVFILAILITGCGKPKPVLVQYPSWFLSPPHNDSSYLYGIGESYNNKGAIDSALNSIASKLNISVESSLESKKSISSGFYSKELTSNIKSSVKKITFNNYEVVHLEPIGLGKVISLVKVDRKKLFDRKRAELESKLRNLDDTYSFLKEKDPIHKLKAFPSFNTKINETRSLSYLVNTINPNYTIDSILKKLESYLKQEEKTKASIRLYISSDNDSKLLKEPLQVALNQAKFKVIDSLSNSQNLVVVTVISRDRKSELNKRYIVKKRVTIKLANKDGHVASSNLFTLVGRSSYGFKQAQESASRSLEKEIQKQGVLQILGIKD